PASCLTTLFLPAPPPTGIYTLPLHDALPILREDVPIRDARRRAGGARRALRADDERKPPLFPTTPCGGSSRPASALSARRAPPRSEEHTSELQSHLNLVCRLLLVKNKKKSRR